jgi:ectoine hydroxylase-related dioxygenase (phytanoyl-CoA dioxygenase family)
MEPPPPAPLPPPLPTTEVIEDFARDGAVVLRGVFKDWVEPLREGTAQLMAAPSPLERSYQPKDGSAPFFQDLCNWQRIPEYRRFVTESGAGRVAAALMQSRTARFFHDHILVKEPGNSIVTPWHQDLPYYCVSGERSVSMWIPLDPVSREVTLELVAGSHRWGRSYKPMRFDGTELYAGDTAPAMPDIDSQRSEFEILGWAMEPGDAVCFHFGTVHGAPGNVSKQNRRRVFSARWVGDGAQFIDRGGKGSPPFRHLALRTGDALPAEEFPELAG